MLNCSKLDSQGMIFLKMITTQILIHQGTFAWQIIEIHIARSAILIISKFTNYFGQNLG